MNKKMTDLGVKYRAEKLIDRFNFLRCNKERGQQNKSSRIERLKIWLASSSFLLCYKDKTSCQEITEIS